MIENFRENSENFWDYNSEILLKILKNTSIEYNNNDAKELILDQIWKEYYQILFQIKNYQFRIIMMWDRQFSYPKSTKYQKLRLKLFLKIIMKLIIL